MTFKPGDRVRLTKRYQTSVPSSPCPLQVGDEGVVIEIYKSERTSKTWAMVRWDRHDAEMHNCKGRCPNGHGWNVPPDIIELASAQPTVWTTLERAIREAEHVIESR